MCAVGYLSARAVHCCVGKRGARIVFPSLWHSRLSPPEGKTAIKQFIRARPVASKPPLLYAQHHDSPATLITALFSRYSSSLVWKQTWSSNTYNMRVSSIDVTLAHGLGGFAKAASQTNRVFSSPRWTDGVVEEKVGCRTARSPHTTSALHRLQFVAGVESSLPSQMLPESLFYQQHSAQHKCCQRDTRVCVL